MKRWPYFEDDEIAKVVEVLKAGEINQWTGPHVKAFEQAYAAHLGRRHAVALANGTLALDLALRVLHLEPGAEVIVTPRSFVASASCVPLAGCVPVFADVDADTQNLSAATIEAAITPKTRAVIVVHLAGYPADMAPIMALARRHGLKVIEDCAQAHGALIDGKPVGTFGDIAAFSFCQDKILTTGGEGGLIALDDEAMWREAWSFKDHGKSYRAVFETEHPPGFRWLHEDFGTNWRMLSIQAVMGSHQLARLERTNEVRAANAQVLIDASAAIPALRTPLPPPGVRHAWYRFYTFVRPDHLKPGWTRDRIMTAIAAEGVPCFSGSCGEMYLEKAFQDAGYGPKDRLPVARLLGETSLAFLVDPAQDLAAMRRVADALTRVMAEASFAAAPAALRAIA
jgi:dTDP-4-amino-4,6-dideoxygalactose transaminase